MPELIVAIDSGTTGIRAFVFDGTAQVRGQGYSELTQHYPQPGWVEHDATEIWALTERVVKQALEAAGAAATDVAAIGITNQRETTVVWDRKTSEPVAPAVVWQCRRSTAICERLKDQGLEDDLRSRTGLVVDAYFSATKVLWYLENIEGVRERAARGELAFGTVDSWLIWKLTGGAVHATEASNASRTMLFNLEEKSWDETILERLGIDRSLLPEVLPTSGRFAETESRLFGAPIPISGIAGDQQSALFGQACFDPGMAKNTYGTGSFLLMNTGSEVHHSQHGLLTTAAWDLGGGLQYALEGAIFITGAAIQWLRDGLGVIQDAAEAGPLAESVPDNGGVYFVPALVGLGAPHWDPYARGTIVGLTRGTTKAHLARAAVEAMAYQTRDVAEAMASDSGTALAELRVDGGASVMDLLCQFQADQLGLPVRRPRQQETTVLGAAYLAGLAEGVWASTDEIAAAWDAAATYEPRMSRDEADALYARWSDAVGRARGWSET